MFEDEEYYAPVEFLDVGGCEDMLDGPAKEAGWYAHPALCMIGCCASLGPFPTKGAAVEADQARWLEFGKPSSDEERVPLDQIVLEPF